MPTKKPKATAPFQVQASLAGPCYPDYGGTVDTSYRHVVLELAIRQTENDFLSERVEFRLEGFSSRRSDGAWSEPLMHGLHFSPSYSALSLAHAKFAVQHLTAVSKYIDKLPVRPQTIGDLVRCIGKLYHFTEVELYRRKDHQSRALPMEYIMLGRLAREAQEAFDALQIKEEVTSA